MTTPISWYQENTWKEFMRWLRIQNVETKWDFKAEQWQKISDDKLIVIIKEGEMKRTKNKMLMQYAIEYVNKTNKKVETLKHINYVQLKKGILLPCEVVGAKGKINTECYNNINEKSPIQWNFKKIMTTPISRYQENTWKEFMRQLRTQNVETKWDFKAEWQWKISDDELIVIIKEGEEEHKYKRINSRGYKYERDDNIVDNGNFKGCIGRKNTDESLMILSIEKRTVE